MNTSSAVARVSSLPVRGKTGRGFRHFLNEALRAPLLSAEEEYELANKYRLGQDIEAAHRLVYSHIRYVHRIAREYLSYGLGLQDLMQEGTVGLMQAVKKFDPDRGSRLATYALWWIRAAIHSFIQKSWRMVRIATTRVKRELFFKLRQVKEDAAPLTVEEAEELAVYFGTDAATVLEVDGRISGSDVSLNQPTINDSTEQIQRLADERPNQELVAMEAQRNRRVHQWVQSGLESLPDRDRLILEQRYMAQEPKTLEYLGQQLHLSRERVRQLEKRAMENLKKSLLSSKNGEQLVNEIAC
ncbi:MAG: RNA polymerase, sigma 32 subunit, RpoH [Magnetococcales bacterium]|nr:RNA polymerase, sigma 32 subunit, RpoH [Magnetococcales bacterium]HIJ83733.1 RNA polymerase factor sigma-32 [Magnetococcales bacterium]